MSDLIAVTGASGVVGARVARRLAESGAAQRLVVRDPARAPDLPGVDVRRASAYGAGGEMRAALAGVATLSLVPAEESADRVAQHRTAVDAAVAAGVRRIVYLSFLGAAPDATFTLVRDHWATEEHIRAAGVPFTFARMSLYMDFVPRMAGTDGVIRGPAGEGRAGVVSRADVADTVAALLTGEGHDGRTYDVTGPEALTFGEMAATLSERSGKRIAYEDQTLAEARASRAAYGAPEWQVDAWISTYTAVAAGELAAVTDTVARLAGHAPQSLADYVRAHPGCMDHVAASDIRPDAD
jgi:NAD(P)H dehydrogenase (quinone)